MVLTKENKLYVFSCVNGHLDPVGSCEFSSEITSHSCCGSRIALTCGQKLVTLKMTMEEGAVEELSWGLDGNGIGVTWSDKDSITIVTKNSVIGY